jgi:undecaprenyl-diphosphatase
MAVARALWLYIEARDLRLMHRVHRWRAPRWIRWWMIVSTRFGDGWFWYALGLAVFLWGGPQRFAALGAAGLATLTGVMIFRAIKNASRRPRPCELEPHCWSLILPPDQFSFPSGHSITAFAIAVPLSLFFPELRVPLVFVASSIAASRILLGMHFLSDVVAGSIIGAGLGIACFRLLS